MTRDLMLSLLRQGDSGEQILAILETIASDQQSTDTKQPTLEPIAF